MSVSQTAEYALRAVVWLARHWSPDGGTPQTSPQLAEATGVPSSYLPKVLQPLIRGGLVAGQRGLHGGYTLQRDPGELTVLSVVQCVDPLPRIEPCQHKDLDVHPTLCPLQLLLSGVVEDTEKTFAQTTVRELLPADSASPTEPSTASPASTSPTPPSAAARPRR